MIDKIKILAESAKYDVSCSSSGSQRPAVKGQLGNARLPGICHSWAADGRCISLLKILMSNHCIYDCAYCVNRASNDVPRATLSVEELVKLTIDFYRRNYIEGLFLSSAVVKSPDDTMLAMIEVVKTLRQREHFNGYIHLKAIPGADLALVERAGRLVDRLSINAELPTSSSLKLLAPQKQMPQIVQPIKYIQSRIKEQNELRSKLSFVPAGQTTQVIIGATPDSDYDILQMSQYMYQQRQLKRVYYSAYVPMGSSPLLPAKDLAVPTGREHRLYQADWLLRFYGFAADEILTPAMPNLDLTIDPKAQWALSHLGQFPVEINRASRAVLLRVPGIGPISANRILAARRFGTLNIDGLKRMGVVLKRAIYFITIGGKYYGETHLERHAIHSRLIALENTRGSGLQLSLLDLVR